MPSFLTNNLLLAALWSPAPGPMPIPDIEASLADTPVSIDGIAISLEQALRHAREHAPALTVARGQLAQGDAALEAAKPLLIGDPVFWGGFGWRQIGWSADPVYGTYFEMQAQIQQPFEIAGERRLRIRAARKQQEVLHKQVEQVDWDLERRVRGAYRAAIVARERSAASRKLSKFTERLRTIAEVQHSAGEISEIPVRVARGQVAQSTQALVDFDYRYLLACNELAALIGWTEARPPEPLGELEPPTEIVGGDPYQTALESQPALKTYERRVEQAQARIKLADRDVVPEPWLGFYLGRETDPWQATMPTTSARPDMTVGLVTLQFNIPFWQRNRGPRAQARAELRISQSERDAYRRALLPQIRAAVAGVNAAARRAKVYGADVLPQFESNLTLLQRAFELGEIDILQVSVARERFLEIQRAALDAYQDYYQAVSNLEALVGARFAAGRLIPRDQGDVQ